MRNQKTIKNLNLVAILIMAVLVSFSALRSAVTSTATQDRATRLFEIVGMDVPLEKRFGSDDGAAFVVHFAGDTRGSLDTCG